MNPTTNVKVEVSQPGEYPPGEEWRGKIREAIKCLGDLSENSDQWVKVFPVDADLVNRVRSAAHAIVKTSWEEGWQLVTKYDSKSETFWMTVQKGGEETEED